MILCLHNVFLDSLWCEPIKDNDTLKDLWISLIDPPEKNFYRFFTKRQSRDNYFVPSALFVLDDVYFNNQFFKVNLVRGIEIYIVIAHIKIQN